MNNINLDPLQEDLNYAFDPLVGNDHNETMFVDYESNVGDGDSEDEADEDCGDKPFFMFDCEDEATLMPLFKEVDSLIKKFSEENPAFGYDRMKRYVGAHVCMEHLTEFIGKFKQPKLKGEKLSGWNIYQREMLRGMKNNTEEEEDAYNQRRKEIGVTWKTFSAEKKQEYKLEAEKEKKKNREARLHYDVSARYKAFTKHWKQFTDDTEDDKLYQTLTYCNSMEAKIASEKIEERLETKSALGFLDRQVARGGAYEKNLMEKLAAVRTSLPANNHSVFARHHHPLISDLPNLPSLPAPANIALSAPANIALPAILPAPASIATKRPRRPFSILKDTDDDYESDDDFQPDDSDSESERLLRRRRLEESDGEPSSAHQPLPDVFEKSNNDDFMKATDPKNGGTVKKVKTTKSHSHGEADKILKELRIEAQKNWTEVTGSKAIPRWSNAFKCKANGQGIVYGIVGWPNEIPTPITSNKKGTRIDINGLKKDPARIVLDGFRDGSIKFQKITNKTKSLLHHCPLK